MIDNARWTNYDKSMKTILPLNKNAAIAVTFSMSALTALIGIGAIDLPAWPFLVFVFYYAAVVGMSRDKLWLTAAGGFAGMITGASRDLLGASARTGSIDIAIIAIATLVTLALHITGRMRALDSLSVFLFAFFTYSAWLTSPAPLLPAMGSYFIAVLFFAGVLTLMADTAPFDPHRP